MMTAATTLTPTATADPTALLAFVEQIARFKTDSEFPDSMPGDDAAETLSMLITEARALSGVHPGHRVYD